MNSFRHRKNYIYFNKNILLEDRNLYERTQTYLPWLKRWCSSRDVCKASVEGGVEIEQLAVERPDALAKVPISAVSGIDKARALEIAKQAGFPAELQDKVSDVFVKLYFLSAIWHTPASLTRPKLVTTKIDGFCKVQLYANMQR